MNGNAIVSTNVLPTIFNVTGGGSYCVGGTTGVSIGLSGSETGVSYQLQLSGLNVGSPVSGTGSAISFGNQTAVGTYVVIATNTITSCTKIMNGNAIVSTNPNLPASVSISSNATANTICSGTTVVFTAMPINGGSSPSYQWKLNGNNVGINSSTYSNTTLANGDIVSVVMTSNASPCVTGSPATSNSITMIVNPNLPASLSIVSNATANTICTGTNVMFTATPINGGAAPNYQWKLNGNNVGSNSSTYSNSALSNNDVVTVVMTSNASSCLSGSPATSNSITMIVNPNLPASLSIVSNATANTICTGTNVMFTATPINGGAAPNYQWKLNGNNVGSNSSTYSNAALTNGDIVSVVMTSNASPCLTGSPATSNSITMTVNPNLLASVSLSSNATANTICNGTTVLFTATPTSGGSSPSYQWKLNGNNVGSNSSTYSNAALTNGDIVSVVMTSNATPCLTGSPATSNAITMTVNPYLSASVSIVSNAVSETICNGTNVVFTATSTNGGSSPSYQWKLNGSNVGINSSTYSNSTLSNNDVVTVVMTSNASPCLTGSPTTSNTIMMIVNSTPALPTVTNSTINYCQNDQTIALDASGSYPLLWYNQPLNGIGSSTAPIASSNIPGTYHYYVSQINGSCEGPRNGITINVFNKPSLGFDKQLKICFPNQVNLDTIFHVAGLISAWSLNNNNVTNTTGISQPGLYQVIVSNSNNCKDTAKVDIVFQSEIIANAGVDDLAEVNIPYQLQGSGGLNYLWSPSVFLSDPQAQNPVAVITSDTKFYLTVSDDAGCKAYDTVFIRIDNNPGVYVPNAFTPNADGLNDMMRPMFAGGYQLENFKVYNRYGQMVFETAHAGIGWNGYFKGALQPSGNYIYLIQYKNLDGKSDVLKGNFLLLR